MDAARAGPGGRVVSGAKNGERIADVRTFKPYTGYKETDVEWLGPIPTHWDAAKMWRVGTAASGGTPSKDEKGYWGGEIPWVSPKDMKRRFIQSSEDMITELALAETGLKLLEPPVVLIVVRGMILAHTFPVAITSVPVTINQDMKALRFRKGIEPTFVAWLFEGLGAGILGAVVEEAAHGTRVIRMDRWRAVTAPVPPEGEQRAIVAFLNRETAKIDALVARKERLIELLQEQRTALITRAVTKGLDPNVPMKDSGVEWLGAIPAHWEMSRLGEAMQLVMDFRGRTPLKLGMDWGGDIPAISAVNVRDGHFDFDRGVNYGSQNLHDRWMTQGRMQDGDIVFTTEAPLGNVAMVPDERQYILSQRVVLLRPRLNRFRADYLFHFLRSSAFRQGVDSRATGSTAEGIKRRYLMSMAVCIPPLEEQSAINALVSARANAIERLVPAIRAAIDRLRELRTALISAAVTGKIDVRSASSRVMSDIGGAA